MCNCFCMGSMLCGWYVVVVICWYFCVECIVLLDSWFCVVLVCGVYW